MSIQLLVRGGALVIGIVGSIHTVYLGLHEIRQVTDSKYVELYNKNNPENKIDLNSLPQYGTPEYDKFNAFQHAYGSAYLAYNFGYEISYIAGILKELITWTSEPDIDDRQRDLWNNEQGQITAIREKLNNKNLEQISEEIYNEIYNNPNTDYIIDPDNTDNKYLDEMTIPNIIQDMFIKLGVCRLGFIEVSPKKRNQSVGHC